MKSVRLYSSLLLAAGAALAFLSAARAEENNPNTIKFSDPSKPGTLKISLGRGELKIVGADTAEIAVKSDAKPASKPRKDGMRELTAASSYSFSEKDNVITLDAAVADWGRGNSNFQVTVPRNTNVIVQNAWGGDITCNGISGDLEINSMHGEIRLEDIGGGAVVGTMNGEIHASVRELRDGKSLSFTAMNGEVVVRVPEKAKANVRLRTQNGTVLTDFDEAALVTKTETTPGVPRGRGSFMLKGPAGSKVITTDVQQAIAEATRIGATAAREALEAVKEGLEASRMNTDEARKRLEEVRRDLDRTERDADRERRETERASRAAAVAAETSARASASATPKPAAPAAPVAPVSGVGPKAPPPVKVPSFTISGGKLVTGTLNGGGPEISIATMNGDVVLRKLEAKK